MILAEFTLYCGVDGVIALPELVRIFGGGRMTADPVRECEAGGKKTSKSHRMRKAEGYEHLQACESVTRWWCVPTRRMPDTRANLIATSPVITSGNVSEGGEEVLIAIRGMTTRQTHTAPANKATRCR